MNRRSFFKTLFGGAASVAVASHSSVSVAKVEPEKFPSFPISQELIDDAIMGREMLFNQAGALLSLHDCEELARSMGILE